MRRPRRQADPPHPDPRDPRRYRYTGKLGSLKRFKDDVKEVLTGQDCGLNIESFNDIRVGDVIEGYEQVEVKRN